MNLTMVKKFNIIITLWLVVVLVTLGIFGYQLNSYGCYIAASVVGIIIIINNLALLISGIIVPAVRQKRVSRQYN